MDNARQVVNQPALSAILNHHTGWSFNCTVHPPQLQNQVRAYQQLMSVAPFANPFTDVFLKIAVLYLTVLASCNYQTPFSAKYCHN